MYPSIKFTAKNWSDIYDFLELLSEKIFFTFLVEFKLSLFDNNIVKMSEKMNQHNSPTLQISA